MNTEEAQTENHRMMDRCEKATEMRLRWIDSEMAERCGEMDFSLYGMEGDALVEGL